MHEERARGWGGGIVRKKRGGKREEMDRNKTVGRGWKRKHDVKAKDEKEKE